MEQNMVLKLMRVREGAIIPKQATAGSAGYDLCACMDAPQTIEPGEKGWYYDEFTVDTAQTGELAVQYDGDALAASVRAAEQSGVRYAVSDVNLKDSVYGGVELTGRIRNDTAEQGSLVCVAAVLLDESEKPLGVVYAVLDSPLEAGAETTFGMSSEMLPPEVKSADIAQVETFAYPLAE